MAETFANFAPEPAPNLADNVVGFRNTNNGGERSFQLELLADLFAQAFLDSGIFIANNAIGNTVQAFSNILANIVAANASANGALVKDSANGFSYHPTSINVQPFSTAGAAQWTKPAGAQLVTVTCIGGGGAGGSSGSTGGGGGGGGGGWTQRILQAEMLATFENVNVGAGGSQGGSQSNGNPGGTSTFGNFVSANGGNGGLRNLGASTVAGGTGGAGQVSGGAGSSGGAANANAAPAANIVSFAAGGGGGGGGGNSTLGGNGASTGTSVRTLPIAGGRGGTDLADPTPGANVANNEPQGGGGGGGGNGAFFTNGNGREGGFPGGGGGGAMGGSGSTLYRAGNGAAGFVLVVSVCGPAM